MYVHVYDVSSSIFPRGPVSFLPSSSLRRSSTPPARRRQAMLAAARPVPPIEAQQHGRNAWQEYRSSLRRGHGVASDLPTHGPYGRQSTAGIEPLTQAQKEQQVVERALVASQGYPLASDTTHPSSQVRNRTPSIESLKQWRSLVVDSFSQIVKMKIDARVPEIMRILAPIVEIPDGASGSVKVKELQFDDHQFVEVAPFGTSNLMSYRTSEFTYDITMGRISFTMEEHLLRTPEGVMLMDGFTDVIVTAAAYRLYVQFIAAAERFQPGYVRYPLTRDDLTPQSHIAQRNKFFGALNKGTDGYYARAVDVAVRNMKENNSAGASSNVILYLVTPEKANRLLSPVDGRRFKYNKPIEGTDVQKDALSSESGCKVLIAPSVKMEDRNVEAFVHDATAGDFSLMKTDSVAQTNVRTYVTDVRDAIIQNWSGKGSEASLKFRDAFFAAWRRLRHGAVVQGRDRRHLQLTEILNMAPAPFAAGDNAPGYVTTALRRVTALFEGGADNHERARMEAALLFVFPHIFGRDFLAHSVDNCAAAITAWLSAIVNNDRNLFETFSRGADLLGVIRERLAAAGDDGQARASLLVGPDDGLDEHSVAREYAVFTWLMGNNIPIPIGVANFRPGVQWQTADHLLSAAGAMRGYRTKLLTMVNEDAAQMRIQGQASLHSGVAVVNSRAMVMMTNAQILEYRGRGNDHICPPDYTLAQGLAEDFSVFPVLYLDVSSRPLLDGSTNVDINGVFARDDDGILPQHTWGRLYALTFNSRPIGHADHNNGAATPINTLCAPAGYYNGTCVNGFVNPKGLPVEGCDATGGYLPASRRTEALLSGLHRDYMPPPPPPF